MHVVPEGGIVDDGARNVAAERRELEDLGTRKQAFAGAAEYFGGFGPAGIVD